VDTFRPGPELNVSIDNSSDSGVSRVESSWARGVTQ
jgi:hypothetical protein